MLPDVNDLYEGSVRRVTRVNRLEIEMEDLELVSAYDGKRKEKISGIGILRARMAEGMLTYLSRRNAPTAFIRRNHKTLRCWACNMFLVEVVVRKAAMGSYLERHPDVHAHWMAEPVVEFFHKQTAQPLKGGGYHLVDGNLLRKELGVDKYVALIEQKKLFADPYLSFPLKGDVPWRVFDAHAPLRGAQPLMEIAPELNPADRTEVVRLAKLAFAALKEGFDSVDCENGIQTPGLATFSRLPLADIKFEFGRRLNDGQIVLADVVDLDSLRLLKDGKFGKEYQLSKQVFRDGGSHEQVLEAYHTGLRAVMQFAA